MTNPHATKTGTEIETEKILQMAVTDVTNVIEKVDTMIGDVDPHHGHENGEEIGAGRETKGGIVQDTRRVAEVAETGKTGIRRGAGVEAEAGVETGIGVREVC